MVLQNEFVAANRVANFGTGVGFRRPVMSLQEVSRCINSQKLSGFSLVELMLILAITGIIASIAIPAYSSYSSSARYTAAAAKLARLSLSLERYYGANKNYEVSVSDLGMNADDQWFSYLIVNPDPVSYRIQAIPQSSDSLHFVLALDHYGRQSHQRAGATEWQPGWHLNTDN